MNPRTSSKNFGAADQTRTPHLMRIDSVDLGSTTVARFAMEPGWRWSAHIGPTVGTDTCQARHVGAVVSGHLHVSAIDGTELDLAPGDAYVIEPGHDAWVTSDEPFVTYEFEAVTAATFGNQ